MVNGHHLELFYYVARHGGITQAVRHIPYPIGQPAISEQMAKLEQDLGASLFERKPFLLTTVGVETYELVKECFDGLTALRARIRDRGLPPLRVATSELVLRDYFQPVIDEVLATQPAARFEFSTGHLPAIVERLHQGEVDLAITSLARPVNGGLKSHLIVQVPLALVVPSGSRVRHARDFWLLPPPRGDLITLPRTDSITRQFLAGLREMEVDLQPTLAAPSIAIMMDFVAAGRGIGVAVLPPQPMRHPKVRLVPLTGFPTIDFAVVWRPGSHPLLAKTIAIVKRVGGQSVKRACRAEALAKAGVGACHAIGSAKAGDGGSVKR